MRLGKGHVASCLNETGPSGVDRDAGDLVPEINISHMKASAIEISPWESSCCITHQTLGRREREISRQAPVQRPVARRGLLRK